MAIEFKYNKSAINELRQQLKIREIALPTLKSKEGALRIEVKKAKVQALEFDEKLKQRVKDMKDMVRLWVEFDAELLKLKDASYSIRIIAGVKIPVLDSLSFEQQKFSYYQRPNWFPDGVQILKELTEFSIKRDVNWKSMEILERARKKTTQKVNLYEKVQIPEYHLSISKIKRFLEDEENLSKSAQKILKRRNSAKSAEV